MDVVIRASSVPTILDCPRRWAGRHAPELLKAAGIEPRQLPISVAASIGTGVHAIASTALEHKLMTGELAPILQAEEAGMAALDKALEEAGEVSWDSTAGNRPDAQRQVRRMGRVWASQIGPQLKPVMVEQRLEAEYDRGVTVTGQMDELCHHEDGGLIRDTKTGSMPLGAGPQLGTYSLLGRSHGMQTSRACIDFIQRTTLKKLQPDARTFQLDISACEAAAHRAIKSMVDMLQRFERSGDMEEFPANPASRLCSQRFCPLWGTKGCRLHLTDNEET